MKKYFPALIIFSVVGCAGPDGLHHSERMRNHSLELAAQMAKVGAMELSVMTREEMIERSKRAVANDLKDPDSANFRNVRVVKYMEGFLVCGEVNAKNSFGGYVGYKQFYGTSAVVSFRREGFSYPGDEYMANAGLIAVCQGNN